MVISSLKISKHHPLKEEKINVKCNNIGLGCFFQSAHKFTSLIVMILH